jgi:DNA-binding MarR family transcriptional regulator
MRSSTTDHARQILEQISAENRVSQRVIAREVGIALGLTNLLLQRMVAEGWVRVLRDNRNQVRYTLSAAGRAEKARRSRLHLDGNVRAYAQARDRIGQRLAELATQMGSNGDDAGRKRIVFCGNRDVAEIGYLCLQHTDLQLVGIVGIDDSKPFFGVMATPFEALSPGSLGSREFDRLVVMPCGDDAAIRRRLTTMRYPASNVFWI